jgi:hypothetical protein
MLPANHELFSTIIVHFAVFEQNDLHRENTVIAMVPPAVAALKTSAIPGYTEHDNLFRRG